MKRSSFARTPLVAVTAVLLVALTGSPGAASPASLADCSSGAHTLSHFGDRVYPEMGNGGYTSLHTDVTMNYDAPTNMFLPGTKVDLNVQRRNPRRRTRVTSNSGSSSSRSTR